jgi:hypothetical protein
VREFLSRNNFYKVDIHGCAVGLTNASGELPIKKPWTIATNCPVLKCALSTQRCPGPGQHPKHAQCRGAEAKRSEDYTPLFASLVHEAFLNRATAVALYGAACLTAPPAPRDPPPGPLGRRRRWSRAGR